MPNHRPRPDKSYLTGLKREIRSRRRGTVKAQKEMGRIRADFLPLASSHFRSGHAFYDPWLTTSSSARKSERMS
jgi:hypothetical protein